MNFSHIDSSGQVTMVDVSHKPEQKRTAIAKGEIYLEPQTVKMIKEGLIKKGDPLACARIAGIMGAKKTAELIPLCHSIPIDQISIDFEIQENLITIKSKAISTAKTGVEMEAIMAVNIAAITIYDMCKAVDKNMIINNIELISKCKE